MSQAPRSPANENLRRPDYFDGVRAEAQGEWEKCQAGREWSALRQLVLEPLIHSPVHVLSELLQNADDAGATKADVTFVDGTFRFHHDGQDFNKDDFDSICRFGVSNKRSLHTIGFRGIGFKSTFSIGDTVQLQTPTLAVTFERESLTVPTWVEQPPIALGVEVRVKASSKPIEESLQQSLDRWTKNPVSLLFFRSLQSLTINGTEIHVAWHGNPEELGGAEADLYSGDSHHAVLVARSSKEAFPEEAVEEIRTQRMAGKFTPPPCSVDIVMGPPGKSLAYSVLPTEVELPTRYSCNGPFLQDPSRKGINDARTSATNGWLLKRCASLAIRTMQARLSDRTVPAGKRCSAYDLLPDWQPRTASLSAGAEVMFDPYRSLGSSPRLLIDHEGALGGVDQVVGLPEEATTAWTAEAAPALFGRAARRALHPDVPAKARRRLSKWKWLEVLSWESIVDTLRKRAVPRPSRDSDLARVWNRVREQMHGGPISLYASQLHLVPVEGESDLQRKTWVIHVGTHDSSWEAVRAFASQQMQRLDDGFVRTVLSQEEGGTPRYESAATLLHEMELRESTNVANVLKRLTAQVFLDAKERDLNGVKLAHLLAEADAELPTEFQFKTQNGDWRGYSQGLVASVPAESAQLLPEAWVAEHMLHDDYFQSSEICTVERWQQWLDDKGSVVTSFPLPRAERRFLRSVSRLEDLVKARHGVLGNRRGNRRSKLEVTDWDFSPSLVEHWNALCESDPNLWRRVLEALLGSARPARLREHLWLSAVSEYGRRRSPVTIENACSAWVERFRQVPCLPDANDANEVPAKLLRLTQDNADYRDVESFVSERIDVPENQALLDALGVRRTPSDVDGMMAALRAGVNGEDPARDAERWYRALSRYVQTNGSNERITSAFTEERLIVGEDGRLYAAPEIFIYPDEDAPGLPCLPLSVRDLSLWHQLSIPDRPTIKNLLSQLRELPTAEKLPEASLKRARRALRRVGQAALRVDDPHWISLGDTWDSLAEFRWALLPDDNRTVRTQLFPPIREQVADFTMLESPPDDPPAHLLDQLEWVAETTGARTASPPPWLSALADMLARATEPEQKEHGAAVMLRGARYVNFETLYLTPQLTGSPAGPKLSKLVHWSGRELFVDSSKSEPALARPMAEELFQRFNRPDLRAAIRTCMFRGVSFVEEYFRTHHTLRDLPETPSEVPQTVPNSDSEAADDGKRSRGLEVGVRIRAQPVELDGAASTLEASAQQESESSTPPALFEPCGLGDAPDETIHVSEDREDTPMTPVENAPVHQLAALIAQDSDLLGDERDALHMSAGESIDEPSPSSVKKARPKAREVAAKSQQSPDGFKGPMEIVSYASDLSLTWDKDMQEFQSSDGRRLVKAGRGDPFGWELLDEHGDRIVRVFAVTHGRIDKGFEVPSDIYDMTLDFGQECVLLVPANDGTAVLNGTELGELKANDRLALYPAAYRLRVSR